MIKFKHLLSTNLPTSMQKIKKKYLKNTTSFQFKANGQLFVLQGSKIFLNVFFCSLILSKCFLQSSSGACRYDTDNINFAIRKCYGGEKTPRGRRVTCKSNRKRSVLATNTQFLRLLTKKMSLPICVKGVRHPHRCQGWQGSQVYQG